MFVRDDDLAVHYVHVDERLDLIVGAVQFVRADLLDDGTHVHDFRADVFECLGDCLHRAAGAEHVLDQEVVASSRGGQQGGQAE